MSIEKRRDPKMKIKGTASSRVCGKGGTSKEDWDGVAIQEKTQGDVV